MATQMCADCGRTPARPNRRTCEDCAEVFAQEWERRHGFPRDPAVVRHELRCQRAAAGLLLGRLTGNRGDELAAMTVVATECYEHPGLTPAAAMVEPLLNLAGLVVDGYIGDELVTAWRGQLIDALRQAGTIAAAEAEVVDDADLIRDCHATEAAAVIMVGRLTGDGDTEAEGWRLVETLAADVGATASGLLLGPVLGLIRDHVHGLARERLADKLTQVVMLCPDPAPDSPAALGHLDAADDVDEGGTQ